MNTPYFQSFLAPFLHQFVQYKRALNRKYSNDAHTLRLFDRYLHNGNIADWHAVDSTVIDDFLKSRPKVGPKRYNLILYALRRFFAFAIMQQWTERSPVTASPRRITGSRIPYLFDLETAKRLLAMARNLPERSRAPYRGLVYETVFALLYGLGLRVGEVSRLKVGDAVLNRNLLFIRETKFAKSRYVPMGPRLAQRLKDYVAERYGSTPASERPMFTFNSKRDGIDKGTISMTFHALLPKLALHIPPGVSPPRLHDLRHSFAVATLRRWYREGIDPNCRLMHLAAFLGHVDPTATSVYLTITEDLLNQAAQRFQALAPKGGTQ
jgi:site-specific recombinase XerD